MTPRDSASAPLDSPPNGIPRARHGLTYWPALDGVRALAVVAVMLFHGGVSWLSGGFLGVDAFFVLSGFLITSLLLHEHATTGRIGLGGFWLRRARRLLPALLLVLAFVVGVFPTVLPRTEVSLLRADAYAALTYWANWRMIYRGGGDYFAQTAAPSPLQHTWSLGIEEQFYVVWPLLVVALLAFGARRYLLWVCLGGAAVSATLAALLYHPLDVNRAYEGTDTRAQALLIGCGLAAVLAAAEPRSGEGRAASSAAAQRSTAAEPRSGEGRAAGQRIPGGLSRWSGGKDLSWEPLRPELVVEVGYDAMEGDRFRHTAQFRRWRPDRTPDSCTYAQLERPLRFDVDEVLSHRG